MQLQQKAKESIYKILQGNGEITMDELLFEYCGQRLPIELIGKFLESIQEEQNTAQDIGYYIELHQKKVLALNWELVLDVVLRFDHTLRYYQEQATRNTEQHHVNQINQQINQNNQQSDLNQQSGQNQQNPHSNYFTHQEKLNHQHITPIKQLLFQKDSSQYLLPPNHFQSPNKQHQHIPKNLPQISSTEHQKQTPTQPTQNHPTTTPIPPNLSSKSLPFPFNHLKTPLLAKSPVIPKLNSSPKQKSQLKNSHQNYSHIKSKIAPIFNSFANAQLTNKSISNSNSNSLIFSKHLKTQHLKTQHLKTEPTKSSKPTQNNPHSLHMSKQTVFQANEFSVLDSIRNIERQKKLQKRKQLQLQKQKKQKQRLAFLKRQMNPENNDPSNEFNSLDNPFILDPHSSPEDPHNNPKQQRQYWKDKKQGEQKNPYFDQLEDNEFDQGPEVIPNFQNQEEVEELQSDLKNHKNLFDERGFVMSNDSKVLARSHSFYSKEYQTLKNKLSRYLIPAYYQYVLQANSNDVIFDKDQIFKKPLMDLTLFLKFYKDFDLKEFLKVADVTKIFKKTAVNHLWIDTGRFIFICYDVIETKSNSENGKDPIFINTEQEILERVNKFIKSFTKEKIKQCLKINNKQAWEHILDEYRSRETKRTVEKKHDNKGAVVDKFLERNFELQMVKIKEKNDIKSKPLNQKSVSQSKVKQSLIKSKNGRDEKSISTDIQKLRSQSQKSINVLKSLFNQKFDEELKEIVNNKSEPRKSQESILSNQKSIGNKAPLHKNKHKNTISAYKEIEQFINENIKIMKTQKTLLSRNLKINEEEPFLNAYFSRQMKSSNTKNEGKPQLMVELKMSPPVHKLSSARPAKSNQVQSNSSSPKKYSIENSGRNNLPVKNMNDFIAMEKLERLRKIHSNSSPSNPSKLEISPIRSNSLKKLGLNDKIREKMSPSEASSVVELPMVKKLGGSRAKLNQLENELINKKLHDFLLNNKEQHNSFLQKKIKKLQKEMSKEGLKTEGQQNLLMENYRHEVYELFKNFVRRGEEEEKIVAYENEKRKGYLKTSKAAEYSSPGKK